MLVLAKQKDYMTSETKTTTIMAVSHANSENVSPNQQERFSLGQTLGTTVGLLFNRFNVYMGLRAITIPFWGLYLVCILGKAAASGNDHPDLVLVLGVISFVMEIALLAMAFIASTAIIYTTARILHDSSNLPSFGEAIKVADGLFGSLAVAAFCTCAYRILSVPFHNQSNSAISLWSNTVVADTMFIFSLLSFMQVIAPFGTSFIRSTCLYSRTLSVLSVLCQLGNSQLYWPSPVKRWFFQTPTCQV